MLIFVAEGYCWSKTSERQVLKIRYKYLEAILRQEVGFFDSQEATTSEVINSISKDTSLIQEVLSEKVQSPPISYMYYHWMGFCLPIILITLAISSESALEYWSIRNLGKLFSLCMTGFHLMTYDIWYHLWKRCYHLKYLFTLLSYLIYCLDFTQYD